jgi:hypothetical protein
VQWGAFAFVYAIGLLSFADARPRGGSVRDYAEGDQFAVTDLLDALRFRDGALRLELDYLRGRRLKTRLTVRADGTGELETVGRGKAALRWIARLRGEPPLQALG